jgi:hypothetical protein
MLRHYGSKCQNKHLHYDLVTLTAEENVEPLTCSCQFAWQMFQTILAPRTRYSGQRSLSDADQLGPTDAKCGKPCIKQVLLLSYSCLLVAVELRGVIPIRRSG